MVAWCVLSYSLKGYKKMEKEKIFFIARWLIRIGKAIIFIFSGKHTGNGEGKNG